MADTLTRHAQRLPKRDSNIAKCVICKQTMDERDKVPLYKLIHRPEDA
jgi:hypothetical protein